MDSKQVMFDENGFSITEGFETVYHVDFNSREYIGSGEVYFPIGVGAPADAYLDMPPAPQAGKAIIRNSTEDGWEFITDKRGTLVYDVTNMAEMIVDYLGEILSGYTPLAPFTIYDEWDGEKWVTNEGAKHQDEVLCATEKQWSLLKKASEQIMILQDAVDLEMATDEEKTNLLAWKKYRIFLNRVDVNQAPDIDWPVIPV